jgi:hypothetical protein
MSLFWCADCGDLKDSDDGCDEGFGYLDLRCSDCMINVLDQELDEVFEDGS